MFLENFVDIQTWVCVVWADLSAPVHLKGRKEREVWQLEGQATGLHQSTIKGLCPIDHHMYMEFTS